MAKLATLAAVRGTPGPIALQCFYSLVNRDVEDEYLPLAADAGMTLFTERNWRIVDAVRRVAAEAGESPARVALAWVVGRPGVASTLMGVSRAEQVANNVAVLGVTLSAEHRAALDTASAGEGRMLYGLFTPAMRRPVLFCGSDVSAHDVRTHGASAER